MLSKTFLILTAIYITNSHSITAYNNFWNDKEKYVYRNYD